MQVGHSADPDEVSVYLGVGREGEREAGAGPVPWQGIARKVAKTSHKTRLAED